VTAMNRVVRYLDSLSLRQRLLVSPLLGLILIALLSSAFMYEWRAQNNFLTEIIEKDFAAFNRHDEVFINLSAQHIALYDLLTAADKGDEETLYDSAKKRLYAIHEAIRRYEEILPGKIGNAGEIKALRSDALALTQAYRRTVTSAVEMATVNIALAPAQVALANERFTAMNRAFSRLLDAQRHELALEFAASVDYGQKEIALLGALGILLAALLPLLSIRLAGLLARSLESRIGELAEMGDPTGTRLNLEGGDEVQRIGRAITAFRQTQLDLLESGQRFRAAFEQAGVGMALREIDSRHSRWLRVNQKLCDMLGYTQDELLQLTSIDVTPPEDRRESIEFSEKLQKGEITSYSREKRYTRKDGRIIWVNVTLSVSGVGGQRSHVISVIEDITHRKETEEKVKRLTRMHTVLSGINSTIVRVADRQELLEESCRIAVEHGNFRLGWIGMVDPRTLDITPAAWAGPDARDYVQGLGASARADHPRGQGIAGGAVRARKPVFSNDISSGPDAGSAGMEEAVRRGYLSHIALPLVVDDAAVGVLVLCAGEKEVFNDDELKLLSELAGDIAFALQTIEKQEKLDYLSYYDELTGLPNRALFIDRAGGQMRSRSDRPAMVAMVLIDLERFRNVNETLGRHGGDEVLRQVARRLESAFNGKDYLARTGADGFAVVVRGILDIAGIVHVVEDQVQQCFHEPFSVNGTELRVVAKAGIAVFPADGDDADVLFRNAEAALKKAKASGERYLFYQPAMNAAVAETLQLENKMRRALDREEFVLHYQPKVDLATGKIAGLEALIRWNDPETGLVPPLKFIPLLEETGMILEAGRWAIRQALADHRLWCGQGMRPPRIAVNVSPIQLRRQDFVDIVRDAIREAGGEPHGLDLEITESVIMDDIAGNIAKLSALREMGVGIAIDDFGTGYSSLGYLAKLPVNMLKIDRSFIITMTDSPESMTIVSTIISLAHSLDLKVVAEGVDAEEQRKYLRLLKCDEMQGYIFSKPLPREQVELLIGRDVATLPGVMA
jgi:diguanylate cyclase (GGDEF)-like protein/PAS domain S-box-containing protein